MNRSRFALVSILTAFLISGCGGAIDATIGGSVQGLSGGTTVVLVNNGTDPLTVSANTTFTFDTDIEAGNDYNVTVSTQPIGETCTVTSGSGTVSQNSGNVTNVLVSCNAIVTSGNSVFGTVTGLATGNSVTLLDNSTDTLVVSVNGSFVFPTPLSIGSTYDVTVSVNPTGQTCTVTSPTGTIPATGSNPTVQVTCN